MSPTIAPFGTWASPISAARIARARTVIDDVLVDPVTAAIYHLESRPSEAGRCVLVETATGKDVFGPGWNARTGVQEYGGAPAVVYAGVVYFSNFADGRVYRVEQGKEPEPVTPENANHRFANFAVHPTASHLLVAVLEDHTHPAPADVANSLVVLDTRACSVHALAQGADFYASPAISPDGARLAWVQWRHPDMPWEGGEVHVADLVRGSSLELELRNPRKVGGAWKKESAVHPRWLGAHQLLFFSDAAGFQNPWVVDLALGPAAGASPRPVLAQPLAQDFTEPDWRLGRSYSAPLAGGLVLCTALRDGAAVLYLLDVASGTLEELDAPYVGAAAVRSTSPHSAVFIAESTNAPRAIVTLTLGEGNRANFAVIRGGDADAGSAGDEAKIDKTYFASPRPLTLRTRSGAEVYAVFYAPTNPTYAGPEGEHPPCIVSVHGGPTGMTGQGLRMAVQFFTSRGFAWVDVNYGGSAGYGRKYIERLAGNWGVADVEDCVDAVRVLASPAFGEIDPARVLVTGGSAGGYTVLQALCAASDAFAAGTSSYGISNLFALAEDTHKFESRYGEKLLGGTAVEIPEVYRARSPVFHAERIKAPLLILQGSLDKVVPPSQAEEMIKVIRAQGGRVEYKIFEGEGHGWRKAENIEIALETELAFYLDVLGLKGGGEA